MLSDNKPLVNITKKSLLLAAKRLQWMLLRLQRYNLDVVYTREKELYIADTLLESIMDSTLLNLLRKSHKSNTQSGLEKSLTHVLTKSKT